MPGGSEEKIKMKKIITMDYGCQVQTLSENHFNLRVCTLKLENRRMKLILQILLTNIYENVYDKHFNTIKSLALRTKSQFENSDIYLDDIVPTGIPKTIDV